MILESPDGIGVSVFSNCWLKSGISFGDNLYFLIQISFISSAFFNPFTKEKGNSTNNKWRRAKKERRNWAV